MSNAVPPPVITEQPPPPVIRRAGTSWLLSVIAGVVAIVFALLDRETHVGSVRETAGSIDTQVDAADLDQVASIAFWGTLGVFGLVLLLEALLVRPLLRGRGWARWPLLVVVVVNTGAVLLVIAFLGNESAGFRYVPHLATGQLILAVVALVLSLLPPASRWFRTMRQTG